MKVNTSSIDDVRKIALIRGMLALREDAQRDRDLLAESIRQQRLQRKRALLATALLLALTAVACFIFLWSRNAQIN
ncbi:MAG: hypothetical protein KatS3mg038_2997 [Candidatus Kapaibacterium sp.]|jgi:hypothetical protein|nr:MAG: hypothetical protein KatS3mg038_2997 [Candidatus Kapabacteria bacterium]